jgi:hypothetical protein
LATLRNSPVKISSSGDDFYVELPDKAGEAVRLRDFGRAGRDRKPYITWLDVEGTKTVPFSRENPSRTGR